MNHFEDQTFDEERSLYGLTDVTVTKCSFSGERDGESPLKECRNVSVSDSFVNLRYPFWHDEDLKLYNCEITESSRAAIWYSNHVDISCSSIHGVKALRECSNVKISNVLLFSSEFGWKTKSVEVKDVTAQGEYFFLEGENLHFNNVCFSGKYSFQYVKNSVFENCRFDTKDAFWHAENVIIRKSIIKGEYLGWYSNGITFEDCKIIGTQPLCYCKDLKLIDCTMDDCDLSLEKSEANGIIYSSVDSIKNFYKGKIKVLGVQEIIKNDPNARGEIIVFEE